MAQLVCTLGESWFVIPEVYYYTNGGFYPDSIKGDYEPVDEIWAITSDTPKIDVCIQKLKIWAEIENIRLKIFKIKGTREVNTKNENLIMAEAILRVVLTATIKKKTLYLNLAGGRKTMSNYLQKAGYFFGASCLFHVIAEIDYKKLKSAENIFDKEISRATMERYIAKMKTFADKIHPIELARDEDFSSVIEFKLDNRGKYTIHTDDQIVQNVLIKEKKLLERTNSAIRDAKNMVSNLHSEIMDKETKENFRRLYWLPPQMMSKLRTEIVDETAEKWLKKIPKADLHCHFGGALSPAELKQVAEKNLTEITDTDKARIKEELEKEKIGNEFRIRAIIIKKIKKIAKKLKIAPFKVNSLFLSLQSVEKLEEYIYGEFKGISMKAIGLKKYRELGDFGGSLLLQTEAAIKENAKIIYDKAVEDNVRYLEVRCSPANYTRGGLSLSKVISTIRDGFEERGRDGKCKVNLIIIATRDSTVAEITQEVAVAVVYATENRTPRIVGFDLAGEEMIEAKKFRPYFLPLFNNCIKITVHAGEVRPGAKNSLDSIWDAIYELHADRIGHGLDLAQNPKLCEIIKEKGVCIELCPTSNDQTRGFSAEEYPLRDYLKKNIDVVINTDNLGISMTTLTKEYIKASKLTKGGLTWWETLFLIKSGFKNSFLDFDEKAKLIREVDNIVYKVIKEKYGET